ncbi:COL4A3BP [Acanthosepion pharaonis]|uniref:Ceramide transfer protein n=1 Tax=Acanthosepion pharaonis TaxID=158019 RepID=A0A812DA24_ACAPH|nr:COL4A3BP [Sepia pharaonis]
MSEERDVLSFTDDEENDEFEEEGHLLEKHGTLSKWTNYLHGWQDRYIVLKDGTFSYFKSVTETAYGCRGAVSLNRACVTPHPFDECRFDVSVNDSVWYLRAKDIDERQQWVRAIELHKTESGYGSENSLKRHGSLLSLTSGTSLSTASASSFKRGRGLREKLAEMETFRDILCRQVDTLQSYFDSCASAVAEGTVYDLTEHEDDDIDDIDDYDTPKTNSSTNSSHPSKIGGLKGRDLVADLSGQFSSLQIRSSILQQHGGHAPDFKGEAYTFKATTAGIIATLSHCIEIMSQREDAWRKRLEREVEKRKKVEESYKTILMDRQKPIVFGGPDYEEGPHCAINEDEFFDAVDAALDKLEKEEERKHIAAVKPQPPPAILLSPNHSLYNEINQITAEHLKFLEDKNDDGEDNWIMLHEEGEMKVYKRELEEDGLVLDPLKAVHTVKGITGHEICHYFWDLNVRMDWEGTLESSRCIEWLSEDTFISHNIIKRVWPASQRDAVFWSHIRHVINEDEEEPDTWIVVNYSTDHPTVPVGKYVRVKMNVSMACQTLIEPPDDGEITRDNITCKISYTANVNPGGWAPASVLRAVYKREYPKFLKRFTSYVKEVTAEKAIML